MIVVCGRPWPAARLYERDQEAAVVCREVRDEQDINSWEFFFYNL
jgi:hypothetical protein